ncbi:ATP-grasp domain-containing protein [Methanolobus sp. WCC5]|uniref:ATP-grasp domain-containing protein n=1 Tax=Methanolobus sp. WCC5 TaxID=3125785 RepID=UPI00324A262F
MKNILVIGFSTRNIICSGTRAGYNMYSIDAFCDHDLMQCAAGARKLELSGTFDIKDISPGQLEALIKAFDVEFDAIIAGSGFEAICPELLPYSLLGNEPQTMAAVSDKYRFSKIMGRLGLPHPKTVLLSEIGSLRLPVMVKPACSGGGIFNMKVENEKDMGILREKLKDRSFGPAKGSFIAQEYISGTPVSVSLISTKEKATAVAVNEQLVGTPWLTDIPFAYCGNITPYDTPWAPEMKRIAEELILELGLTGSIGVDLIIGENGPVVIEVNARFQGSLDTVEMATGINLFNAHLRAFKGEACIAPAREIQYAGRAILYAQKDIVISAAAHRALLCQNVCDIPASGQLINAGEPVISVICTGKDREDVLSCLKESVMFIRETLNLLQS